MTVGGVWRCGLVLGIVGVLALAQILIFIRMTMGDVGWWMGAGRAEGLVRKN